MIKIENKSNCCGCMACVQICHKQCISMLEDNEGFLYPEVDETICVNCHLCEQVCPVINQTTERLPIKVYAAINRSQNTLKYSSSGGIFTLLAEKILAANGIVFGVTFDDKWEVCHTYIDSIEDIEKFRGSKYVQSRIGTAYVDAEKFLKEKRKVLFTGTPCQIAGLKKYLRKEYENLYCVDVICHGVPSPGIWRSYLDTLQEKSKITSISFRDKTDGWRRYSFVLKGVSSPTISSKENLLQPFVKERDKCGCNSPSILLREHVGDNLFMRGFLNNLYLRPSCYDCPSRTGKSDSDILLGDFWGILRCHPEFYNPEGVSLVLTYSEKGDRFFKALDCIQINATYDEALDCNINIEKNESRPNNRDCFFEAYSKRGISIIDKYCRQLEPDTWTILRKKVNYKLKRILNK